MKSCCRIVRHDFLMRRSISWRKMNQEGRKTRRWVNKRKRSGNFTFVQVDRIYVIICEKFLNPNMPKPTPDCKGCRRQDRLWRAGARIARSPEKRVTIWTDCRLEQNNLWQSRKSYRPVFFIRWYR